MSTQPNPNPNSSPVSEKSLWFGFSAAAYAWIIAGIVDVILAWHVCMGGELNTNPVYSNTGMHVLLGVVTFGLLAVATIGGVISFKNWRKLSDSSDFLEAEGRAP